MVNNLEWFRTFKTIYETGTLSAAAQALFISQPGVSLHLSSLESFTGQKLFERSARRMIPTEQGKILYHFILEPLQKLEVAEQNFHKRSSAARPTIRVGMCFETFQYTLEEHIAQLPFNLIIKFGEYTAMQKDLDNGLLDLIISPKKGNQQNLDYRNFSKERIVLVAGKATDTSVLTDLLHNGQIEEAGALLKQQLWYSSAGDMEHLTQFWQRHFNEQPNFIPNYIVPNISSIIRCLQKGSGFSVVPDFLCQEAFNTGEIKLIWVGDHPVENTLYFGTRKKTIYEKEIRQLEEIFQNKWG
ncbi:LysR family transcriptional regulator [Sphingobacterium sp. lm-10]|uniref:LysR family transcriptional regulator n=1 Tax=Sphingobacterium sp. lm-10 TaxID=2944904 RepID=UPI0020228451|nr:LysR family transcriptional regulator [Sphingobacterium sp. lm-10]MCL7989358.1 LysR family transcriptional regulator [Sphingobacterium sp. lm-10]